MTALKWTRYHVFIIEPRHDKTNKVTVRPAKTQISLGIRPVWSESSLSTWRKLWSLATHWAQAKTLIRPGGCPGWSESSLGAQLLCCFFHVAAHMPKQVLLAIQLVVVIHYLTYEPSHEIMVLFVLRKLIVQTRMRSHPVGLDVW